MRLYWQDNRLNVNVDLTSQPKQISLQCSRCLTSYHIIPIAMPQMTMSYFILTQPTIYGSQIFILVSIISEPHGIQSFTFTIAHCQITQILQILQKLSEFLSSWYRQPPFVFTETLPSDMQHSKNA